MSYKDVRGWIEQVEAMGELKTVRGADWNLEIGALSVLVSKHKENSPALLFDQIKDYPAGYRVCSLPYAAYRRVALALGLPTDKPKLEILRMAARKVKHAEPMPPKEVSTSPLFENKLTGSDVDLLKFPALRFHWSPANVPVLGTAPGEIGSSRFQPDVGILLVGHGTRSEVGKRLTESRMADRDAELVSKPSQVHVPWLAKEGSFRHPR